MNLASKQDLRIRRAFYSMPYGPLAGLQYPPENYTPEQIAENLERLNTTLREVVARNHEIEQERDTLKAERTVVRQFFSLGESMDTLLGR